MTINDLITKVGNTDISQILTIVKTLGFVYLVGYVIGLLGFLVVAFFVIRTFARVSQDIRKPF